MDINEWNDLTRNILANAGDQSQLTALLTQATDGFSEQLTKAETATAEAETLKADNESLRKANMDFFLRLGEQKKQELGKESDGSSASGDRAETITFEDLFKEES